jgi:hypothetical protein
MFDALFVSVVSLDFCGIFWEIQKFPLYCTLLCTFWENQKLPLCCGFQLCIFFGGGLLGDTNIIWSLWISVEYFGKSENFHSIALYCVLFGKTENSHFVVVSYFVFLLWGLTWGYQYYLVFVDFSGIFREIQKFLLYCTLLCTFLGITKNFHSAVVSATSPKVCL